MKFTSACSVIFLLLHFATGDESYEDDSDELNIFQSPPSRKRLQPNLISILSYPAADQQRPQQNVSVVRQDVYPPNKNSQIDKVQYASLRGPPTRQVEANSNQFSGHLGVGGGVGFTRGLEASGGGYAFDGTQFSGPRFDAPQDSQVDFGQLDGSQIRDSQIDTQFVSSPLDAPQSGSSQDTFDDFGVSGGIGFTQNRAAPSGVDQFAASDFGAQQPEQTQFDSTLTDSTQFGTQRFDQAQPGGLQNSQPGLSQVGPIHPAAPQFGANVYSARQEGATQFGYRGGEGSFDVNTFDGVQSDGGAPSGSDVFVSDQAHLNQLPNSQNFASQHVGGLVNFAGQPDVGSPNFASQPDIGSANFASQPDVGLAPLVGPARHDSAAVLSGGATAPMTPSGFATGYITR